MSVARGRRLFLPVLCAGFALLFAALGVWQVERLRWKLNLIARVEARLAATPVPIPPAAEWSRLLPREIEYRRVRVEGTYDHVRTTYVDALTERGAGNWVVTPLRTAQGIILVNRGFAPKSWSAPAGEGPPQAVTGLLRLSEPDGRVLRPNRPAEDAWFSRDVPAIAARRELGSVAPFFIDAAAEPGSSDYPIGGLTVVRFRNSHLVYALTWFALAALSLFGLVLALRSPHKGD